MGNEDRLVDENEVKIDQKQENVRRDENGNEGHSDTDTVPY